jgi:hypothetical protein
MKPLTHIVNLTTLAVCLVALTVFSCKNDSIPPTVTYSSDVFPNSVGDEWVYDVFDSVDTQQYKMRVSITGTSTLIRGNFVGESAKIWM